MANSDYAGDVVDRKLTTGVLVKLFETKLHISRHPPKLSMSLLVEQLRKPKYGLLKIKLPFPIRVCTDCSSVKFIAESSATKRTRYIDIAYDNVHQKIKSNNIR